MAFIGALGGSLLTAVNGDDQIGNLLGQIPVVGNTLGQITDTTTSIIGGVENSFSSITSNLLSGFTGGSNSSNSAIIEDVLLIGGVLVGIGVIYYVVSK